MRIDRNTFEVKIIGDRAAANEPGFPQKPDFSDSLLYARFMRQKKCLIDGDGEVR